ncbi:hypothetical protein [Streptomyces sp. NBC_00212]|uniref:hypothetical protein n=1 Tax=Streptomyces sp. NBC_00212 TaxID=2975684 RepID=UPI003253B5F1
MCRRVPATEERRRDGQDHEVRRGAWMSNPKTHRDKPNVEQLAQLTESGTDWT